MLYNNREGELKHRSKKVIEFYNQLTVLWVFEEKIFPKRLDILNFCYSYSYKTDILDLFITAANLSQQLAH